MNVNINNQSKKQVITHYQQNKHMSNENILFLVNSLFYFRTIYGIKNIKWN